MFSSVRRITVLRSTVALCTMGALALFAACRNPIDVALDAALDFSGVYQAMDGLEVELSGSEAVVTRLGSATFSVPLKVGDKYMLSMYPSGANTWTGYARSKTGFLDPATVTINGSAMTITRTTSTAPAGQDAFTKIASTPTTGGTGGTTPTTGGTGGTTPTGTTCAAQWVPVLTGNWRSTSMVIDGTGEVGGSGPNDLVTTFALGATSFREISKRNNGTGTTYDYIGSYTVKADAAAALIGGNRCSIASTWIFNGSTNGTTTFKILGYSGGVLDVAEPGIRYKLVK